MIPLKKQKLSLLERCKKADRKAYGELYQLYAKAMFNISLRIVSKREEAEDILQNSFTKAFQQIAQFENEKAFASWLKRVVINNSIDVVRKQKTNFLSTDEVESLPAEEISDEVEMEYDIPMIHACMEQLPEGYRIVFSLYLFEELNHKEIAELLNISEGTSKSQYMRARKRMIVLLQTYAYEEMLTVK